MSKPFVIDPDLEQAIEDMAPAAARLRAVNERILLIDPVMQWKRHTGARAEAQQCRDLINLRAQRLLIEGAALLLMVDEAMRLRKRFGRKASREQLASALRTAFEVAARRDADAAAALSYAQADAAAARRDLTAGTAARRAYTGEAA